MINHFYFFLIDSFLVGNPFWLYWCSQWTCVTRKACLINRSRWLLWLGYLFSGLCLHAPRWNQPPVVMQRPACMVWTFSRTVITVRGKINSLTCFLCSLRAALSVRLKHYCTPPELLLPWHSLRDTLGINIPEGVYLCKVGLTRFCLTLAPGFLIPVLRGSKQRQLHKDRKYWILLKHKLFSLLRQRLSSTAVFSNPRTTVHLKRSNILLDRSLII